MSTGVQLCLPALCWDMRGCSPTGFQLRARLDAPRCAHTAHKQLPQGTAHCSQRRASHPPAFHTPPLLQQHKVLPLQTPRSQSQLRALQTNPPQGVGTTRPRAKHGAHSHKHEQLFSFRYQMCN